MRISGLCFNIFLRYDFTFQVDSLSLVLSNIPHHNKHYKKMLQQLNQIYRVKCISLPSIRIPKNEDALFAVLILFRDCQRIYIGA